MLARWEAQRDAAVYNFFPWVTPGVGFKRHDGRIQDVTGNLFDTSKQSLAPGVNISAVARRGARSR